MKNDTYKRYTTKYIYIIYIVYIKLNVYLILHITTLLVNTRMVYLIVHLIIDVGT